MIRKRSILLLATFTLLAFPLIGFVLFYFIDGSDWQENLIMKDHWAFQLITGSVFGFIAAQFAQQIIRLPFFQVEMNRYKNMIGPMQLGNAAIIYISFCAGFGEELLFRASIQPLAGLLFTSILFVALHGYLNPMNWRISIYGIYLTGVIYCIGFCYEKSGILFAISAHTFIDIVLLNQLAKSDSIEN